MKSLLLALSLSAPIALMSQITITAADMGQAGDSLTVGYETPSTAVSVGGTGSQSWSFTFGVDNINTLKFEYVANTSSGAQFPNASLAIERQADTSFYGLNSSALTLDGFAGDIFNLGVTYSGNFSPDATLITFPSTLGTNYIDTAVFDTVVDCLSFGFGSICDSAHAQRTTILNSNFNAFGPLETSGGSYTTIRQHLIQLDQDRIWVKVPFIGWQSTPYVSTDSTTHNYRWYANGEKWPVLSVVADGANGNIVTAEFQIDNLLAFIPEQSDPSCADSCDGSATVAGLGADPPYTYAWPVSAGNQTTATATGLCAGLYQVTITDNDTTNYVLDVELTNPEPVAVTGSVQGSGGSDGAIDITASGGNGLYTYAWSGPNGFMSTIADISGLDTGSYTVYVTDGNGCQAQQTFQVQTTGVKSVGSARASLFPNPTVGALHYKSTGLVELIVLTDLLGNTVSEIRPLKKEGQLDLSSLAAGLYLVELVTAEGRDLQKVTVKEH